MKDPDWVLSKIEGRRQRLRQIHRFRECQRRKFSWISFEDIADWCAREPGTVRRDERLRAQAYADLRDAILAGEFESGCRSQVLYLQPDRETFGIRVRLEPAQLQKWLRFYGAHNAVITTELSRCWLSRNHCRRWFERRGLAWPNVLDPLSVVGDLQSNRTLASSNRGSRTPPRLLQGPKGGEQKPASIAWEITEEILSDEARKPPAGRGRLTSLARLVKPLLERKGFSRELDTITKQLRPSFREWEKQNPDK